MAQLLKEQIKKKDDEINELKIKLSNSPNSDKGKLVQAEQMTCVYFTSMDQKIHYPIPCLNTDIFAFVEEKLYCEFPEYRETNNYFIMNDMQILRFKTIKENKIKSGLPVMLIVPSNDANQ